MLQYQHIPEMEVKEGEKIVIAKPVASRPTFSSCRSFSELLTSAINASPSAACSHAVTAIRPKTLRFKPVVDYASAAAVSFQGASGCIYQQELAELEAHFEQPKGVMSQPKLASELYLDSLSQLDGKQLIECSKLISQNLEEDEKNLLHTNTVDRLSYAEYNWRKYGKKQVKGSEYPRSYYKCTHPGCPVKKMVESSLDGQIAEIVYKGEHNHSKPEPLKRSSSDRQGQGFVSDTTCSETNNPPWNIQLSERNENCKTENQNDAGSSGHSTYSSSAPPFCDPMMTAAFHAGAHVAGTNCGLSEECDEGSKYLEAEVDGPKGKRRRNGNQLTERCISGEGTKEPCIIVQNPSDSDILGDGFHWRKYGQKVVKGNPYPRSYYRCTSVQCNVRKYVERTSDVLGAFVTTYEGKHNHDMPIKSTNLAASKMNMKIVSTKEQL